MSFPRYERYKESGVEWLGEVPEGWEVCSFRHSLNDIFNGVTSNQVDETDSTVPVTRIETISSGFIDEERLGFIEINDAREDRKLIAGDILFSNINSLNMIGNCAIYEGGRVIYAGMNLLVLRPVDSVVPKWLYWKIRSALFRQVVESLAKPAINQASISQTSINSISVAIPAIEEQLTIATFLDRETGKIDALVAKQERLIGLLKEKRQAMISHAVTKGLNPDAPMKDSGIEWLGEVPEGWEVKRLKHVIEKIESGTSVNATDEPAEDGALGVLKTSCVYTGQFDPRENKTVIKEELQRVSCQVEAGTLIVSRMNTPDLVGAAGLVTIAPENIYLPDRLWQVSIIGADPSYVHYWTLTTLYRGLIRSVCAGTSSSMQNLGQDQFRTFVFAVPPMEEQSAIVAFLDSETAKIDTLVGEAQQAISLLKERRSALISAAVTGKIDVRNSDRSDLSDLSEGFSQTP